MTEQTLARARAGDEDAFRELTDPYRRELQLHIYRIVGCGAGRRGPAPRDAARRMARPRAVRGTRVGPHVALPDRHQPLAGCAAREPSHRRPADDADARADTLERADLARAVPRRSPRGDPGRGSGTGGALRDQGGDRPGVHRRPSASPAAAARGARAARRAGLPRRGGRRDARDQRGVGQQPAASGACGVRVASAGRRTRTGAAPELQARAGRSSAASPTPSRRATSTAWSPC